MKNKRKNKYISYELLKNEAESKNLSPKEYEKAIQKIARKRNI